jgi:RNA polymerase sigma factor (sigma-70 family)
MAACTMARDRADNDGSDSALALRAKAGDEVARDELLARYIEQFLIWIRRWLKTDLWEKDIAVDAANRLNEKLPQYNPTRAAFKTWAFRVARTSALNKIRDLHIDAKDVSYDTLLDDSLTAVSGPADDYINNRLHEEVGNLEFEQSAVLSGRFFEGLPVSKLMRRLHLTRRQVRYRGDQGLEVLRVRLADVPFMSIWPSTRFHVYNYIVNSDRNANEPAQPGGEDGD